MPNVLDVVDESSAFDEISIPNTPDIDMEELNLMTTLEGEQTNYMNENTNEMNENTIHTEPPLKLNEYSPYPHASGRVGVTANACPHRCSLGLFFV